ncbi:hypothetical protein GGR51DRAFT_572588 [Nemania sp. FL0031]|nr:hypothetical protein GGR51DRAFT_572588 [Nemania sp. FL0031]
MPLLNVVRGSLMTNLPVQDSSTDSSEPGTRPVTPDTRPHHSPDTSPESLNKTPGNRRQALVRRGGRRSADLETGPIIQETTSAEVINKSNHSFQHSAHNETDEESTNLGDRCSDYSTRSRLSEDIGGNNSDQCSHHSTQSQFSKEVSVSPSPAVTPVPYPDQEERRSPLYIVKSIYFRLVRQLTLAKNRKSARADDARVQDIIDLITSTPKIRRTQIGNLKRKLTTKQFRKLVGVLEDPGDRRLPGEIKDGLRFDYTSHRQQFEIRMPTVMHSGVAGLFADRVERWRGNLEDSPDDRISKAAKSSETDPEMSIWLEGLVDTKAPDCSMTHKCQENPSCYFPSLVLEVAWTETKEELRQKAHRYVRLSNGAIRTVVAVYMNKMYKAEVKNEKRLERMYVKGEVDESGSYSYCEDENNITGSASILMWRARKRNNTIVLGNLQEKMFRDEDGNPIKSTSLQLQLQDFVCQDIADPKEKWKRFKAPPLEISSELLCERIQNRLKMYRTKRPEAVKLKLEEKEKKKLEEEERKKERLQRANEAMTHEARSRISEDDGLRGRIYESGKWLSARIRAKK